MPLRLEDIINYRGDLQPDRWSLHPADFRIRMDWEYERQRILNAQAEAIEKKLPSPKEQIPPIPRLLHPEYVTKHVTKVTKNVTENVTPAKIVTSKRDMPLEGKKRPMTAAERKAKSRARRKGK